MRRLVLMFDYGADPTWDDATGDMLALESVPLSDDVRERLRDLAARWEEAAWGWLERGAPDEADWEDPAWRAIHHEMRGCWLLAREELRGRCEIGLAVPSPPDGAATVHVLWSPDDEPEQPGWLR